MGKWKRRTIEELHKAKEQERVARARKQEIDVAKVAARLSTLADIFRQKVAQAIGIAPDAVTYKVKDFELLITGAFPVNPSDRFALHHLLHVRVHLRPKSKFGLNGYSWLIFCRLCHAEDGYYLYEPDKHWSLRSSWAQSGMSRLFYKWAQENMEEIVKIRGVK